MLYHTCVMYNVHVCISRFGKTIRDIFRGWKKTQYSNCIHSEPYIEPLPEFYIPHKEANTTCILKRRDRVYNFNFNPNFQSFPGYIAIAHLTSSSSVADPGIFLMGGGGWHFVLLSFSETLYCCSPVSTQVYKWVPSRMRTLFVAWCGMCAPMKWRLARTLLRALRRCTKSAGLILNQVTGGNNTL